MTDSQIHNLDECPPEVLARVQAAIEAEVAQQMRCTHEHVCRYTGHSFVCIDCAAVLPS